MADLSDRSTDRAQLLIIAGVGLALLLVVMAMTLNTAVYGGVHVASTDDSLQEERAAMEYQDAVERGVGGVLPRLSETGEYPDLEAELDAAVLNVTEMVDRLYADDGVATKTSAEPIFETAVNHSNASRNFTNKGHEETDWIVADNVNKVGEYNMTIHEDELADRGQCASKDECFNITVNGGDWDMAAWNQSDDIYVEITAEGEKEMFSCHEPQATFDFVNGNISGCENETFTTFTDVLDTDYQIRYTGANYVTGTYTLNVDGELDDSDFYESDSGKSPRIVAELVAADVTVEYRTANLHYSNEFRIKRGEDYG